MARKKPNDTLEIHAPIVCPETQDVVTRLLELPNTETPTPERLALEKEFGKQYRKSLDRAFAEAMEKEHENI